jgi:hypothetical protein
MSYANICKGTKTSLEAARLARFEFRILDFGFLNLNTFHIPVLSIRNPQSAFRNQFTVTRSCGILTRFPSQTKQTYKDQTMDYCF